MRVVNANPDSWTDDQNRSENVGWIAGFLLVAAVLAIGAAFWFKYHP